jgi:hypothetical protein
VAKKYALVNRVQGRRPGDVLDEVADDVPDIRRSGGLLFPLPHQAIEDGVELATSLRLKGASDEQVESVMRSAYSEAVGAQSEAWLTQAEWYIDSDNGDDEGDGSAIRPLRTINEYLRRMGSRTVTVLQKVYLSGDFDEGNYVFEAIYQRGCEFYGERTVIGTGTLTDVQAWSAAAETDGQVEDTSIPTSWTASGYVGNMMVMTSGTNAGAVTWIGKDLGSKNARHSPMSQLWGFSMVTPSIGDDYEIVSLNTISGSFLFKGWSSGWGFGFQDLHLHFTPTDAIGFFGALDGWLYLIACELTAESSTQFVQTGYVLDAFHSKIQLGSNFIDVTQGALFGLLYSLIGSQISGYEGANIELGSCLLQNDLGGTASTTITLSRNAVSVMFSGVTGYYDEDNAAESFMKVTGGGILRSVTAKAIGSGNAGYGLLVNSRSAVLYKDGDNLNDHFNMGTTGTQVRYGGTDTTYAAIGSAGVVNAANHAIVVPSE